MRRLPPLNALRAFEAAARHLSFTRAAHELCVTQAAVSHQVKQLEDSLGMPLFERRGHRVALTAKGKLYLADIGDALDRIASASLRLESPGGQPLRITVLPSLASRWLVPRLAALHAALPGVDLRLDSSAESWTFSTDRFDFGIRSGLGKWPGLKADLIARETLSPVCAPSLLDGTRPLRKPADLRHRRLLSDTPREAWRQWFDLAGVDGQGMTPGVVFNDAGLALQAAVAGQGVALGRLMLAADDLRDGRLARPFDIVLPNDFSYWLVYQPAVLHLPGARRFRDWLLAEAASCAAVTFT